MSPIPRYLLRSSLAYAAVCAALWPFPVFGLLHAEAGAVVAGAGCLIAGVGGVGALRGGVPLRVMAGASLGVLAVPVTMLTVSLLWRPNCAWLDGLGLFLLLVPPSVLFGLGLAVGAVGFGVRVPRTMVVVAALGVAVGGVLFDLLLHPQLFTYSHVFGGVLGPIYDSELAVRPGLWAAKAQTLLWAAALVVWGSWASHRGGQSRRAGVLLLVALGASYALAGPLGIVQTERGIRRVLSDRVDLGPVVLHLAPDTPRAVRQRVADEALFRFETLSRALDTRPEVPVDIYLYPDPDTKAALIGSRETSVVPVWLPTPQVHMLTEAVPRSLGHELVHALAREFGAPVTRASPAIGLVEGLAVALEAPDGTPGPAALVRAGSVVPELGVGDPASVVTQTMSPSGFWTARAGIAYTANGAFTGWLLRRYGAERLRRVYRSGRFETVYGQTLAALARDWADSLGRRPIDPEAVAVARWTFSQPSLFEVRCPHHVPDAVRLARDGAELWDEGRAGDARTFFDRAVAADPVRLDALRGQSATWLATRHRLAPDALRRASSLADSLPTAAALAHLAEVGRLAGADADVLFQAAADSLAPVDALGRALLRRRALLGRPALARWLAAPLDSVTALMERDDPVLAGLRHAAADRPVDAWRLARGWCLSMETPRDAAALRLAQASIASRAGAFDAADARLDGLADAFAEAGPRAYVPLVAELSARTAWRRRTARNRAYSPSIFDAPSPVPDALDPRCPGARPDRRVRRPR